MMNQQERFEAYYADQHGVTMESMILNRMGDTYRMPGLAAHYRTFKGAEDGMADKHIDPVKVSFSALSYGAKYKYELEHGNDKIYVKIGHNLVASWDERFVASYWIGQGVFSFSHEGDEASDLVYLVG